MALGIWWENLTTISHRVHLIIFRLVLVLLLPSILHACRHTYMCACINACICIWCMYIFHFFFHVGSVLFFSLTLSLSLCLVCKFHRNYVKEYTLISERNWVCSCSIDGDSLPVQSYNRTRYFGVRDNFLLPPPPPQDWFLISSNIMAQIYENLY